MVNEDIRYAMISEATILVALETIAKALSMSTRETGKYVNIVQGCVTSDSSPSITIEMRYNADQRIILNGVLNLFHSYTHQFLLKI